MNLRNLLAFGTGIGIQIEDKDLEVVIARARPLGIDVLGRTVVAAFRQRPAAEWGAEYAAFRKQMGAGHLSATVLLPRSEIIVRQIALPGVAAKDLDSAVSFQLDSLHPYGEDDVVSGWVSLGGGQVLVGIVRRTVLERYTGSFAEAGIAVASFTFSASVFHAALRLTAPPPAAGFVGVARAQAGSFELYGENTGRPLFSAEFELPLDRAAGLAAAELRLPPDTAPVALSTLLPSPRVNPVENDLTHNTGAYAAALSAACPWLASAANLLPAEQRASSSRLVYVPTAVLAALVLLVAVASLGFTAFEDHRYLKKLQAEIHRLEATAQKTSALDRYSELMRERIRLLDEFRGRTRSDLEVINELTRIVPPPVWSNGLEVSRTSVTVQGEAEQAARLIKILDDSPFFQNSELFPVVRMGNNEVFRIRTEREARK